MKTITDYLKSIRFSLGYSFQFVPHATFIMAVLYMFSGVLPYGSAYLLGKLVDSILLGAKNGAYGDIWYVLMLYAFVSALPTIIGNLQLYVNRKRMLKLQMETDLDILKRREQIDIAQYEDPTFQDLIQRTFRGGVNPIFQMSNAQFDTIHSLTSLVLGTFLAIHFNLA